MLYPLVRALVCFLAVGFMSDGQKSKFEDFRKHAGWWLDVSVYSPEKGYFATVSGDMAERKNAEVDRQMSASIFELATDSIFVHDLDGKILFFNDAACKSTGYSKEEMAKMNIHDLDVPETGKLIESRIADLIEKGDAVFNSVQLHKDGANAEFEIHARMIDHGGKKLILSVARDISERKKNEEKVKELQEQLLLQVNRMPIGLIVWDGTFRAKTWNPAAAKIFGFTEKEALGKHPYGLIVPKGVQPVVDEIWGRLLKGDKTANSVNENITKDGRTIVCDWSNTPLKKDDGTVVGVLSMVQDITERMKMEQQISSSLAESQLRGTEISALLEASKAVLQNRSFQDSARAIFDVAKELIGATAGYVALLSKNGKENEVLFLDAGGLPCTVDPTLPMPIRGLRAEAYLSGKVAFENDFPCSEWKKFMPIGHVELKNVLFAPLIINQKPAGVIGLANKPSGFTQRDGEMAMAFGDIASVALDNSRMLEKLKENEKELTAHSEHLEEMVEERTQKLRDSERLAAIGATAGMVGHDIRNPLQSITGDLYLAKSDLDSVPECVEKAELKESLDSIEHNVEYINKIVADLQDFAKPLTPKIENVDVEKIVSAVFKTIKIPENIHAGYQVVKDFSKVQADPTYLQRILINLSSNAIQAMPKGGKLTISVTHRGNKAIIAVQDTGEGIPESVKNKIFAPLVTTKAKGQGFGLAAVKRFTEAMDGAVTFETEAGKGTKFIVSLPIEKKQKAM